MASGHGFIFCRFIHARFPHLVVHNAYILKRSTRGDVIGVPQDKAPGHVLNGAYDSDGFLGHLFPAAAQEETGGGAALYLDGGPQLLAPPSGGRWVSVSKETTCRRAAISPNRCEAFPHRCTA